MLKIQEYLNNNSLEQLTKELSIKVKRHSKYSNLVHFCYSQIDSPYYHSIVKECRGLILDEDNDWNIVAYPFNRFYNESEDGADNIDWITAKCYPKMDGTLIVLANYKGEWNISTKGTPDAGGKVGDNNITFSQLAWKIFEEQNDLYTIKNLDPNFTYMFELCSLLNRVVIAYKESQLTLIGVRDNRTLQERDINTINNLKHPFSRVLLPINLNTKESLIESFTYTKGIENEGYVVVDLWFNRLKIKHPSYVALSNIKSGFSKKRIVEMIRNNEGSEFLSYFPEYINLYNDVLNKYVHLCHYIDHMYYLYIYIDNIKEFALAIKDYKFKAILFSLKKNHISSIKEGLLNTSLDTLIDWLDNPT